MFRQGDILLVPFNPGHEDNRFFTINDYVYAGTIVAEGEITGHMHRLSGGGVYDALGRATATRIVVMERDGEITHDEHHAIPLKKGYYRVVQQREYDGIRSVNVID